MDLASYGITHNYNLVEKFSRVLRLITGDGFCFRMWGIDRNLALLVCYWVDWKWENFTGNSDIDIVIYIYWKGWMGMIMIFWRDFCVFVFLIVERSV